RGGLSQAAIKVTAIPLAQLPVGYITTVAGGSTFAGEGTPARTVSINPAGIAVDSGGNVFIADDVNRKIRRVDSRTAIITTVAGTGVDGNSGDNGLATAARFSYPDSIAFDPSGNLLIADGSIRMVNAITGVITTVVGDQYGYCGGEENALNA